MDTAFEADLFPGFAEHRIDTGESTIYARIGGAGPPLLLLHGYPQTHAMWHAIASALAERITVVAADLRGYGRSSKPPTTADHEPYSKRAMARDQVAVMRSLGFERFFVAGHDRGARCAYRMAIDHPERVAKLAILDIIPTSETLRRADREFLLGYWHWGFLAQPYDLPERLVGADPDAFFFRTDRAVFSAAAFADYRRAYRDPATIHAMCEDYRAGVTLDAEHDEVDRGRRRVRAPLLALWGSRSKIQQWYDVLAIWREWADDVHGRSIDAGHYLAEEAPAEVLSAFLQFFADSPPR